MHFCRAFLLATFWTAASVLRKRLRKCPLRFRVTLAREAAAAPVSGRLLVFMTDDPVPQDELSIDFFPGRIWVAAEEYENSCPEKPSNSIPIWRLTRARSRRRNPEAISSWRCSIETTATCSKGPVTMICAGRWFVWRASIPAIRRRSNWHSTARGATHEYQSTEDIKVVEYRSPLLTRFWGRPITMRAAVVLPPSYTKSPRRRYPALYLHHGFGGDYRDAFSYGPRMRQPMAEGKVVESVLVFLDASCPTGDHEFADSVNNGEWGRALTEEFIPWLERNFRLIPKPAARFLTGHSSGGWASLWLEVTYPDYFGGTWSTAPDPVDFRSFTGIDATPGSKDNAYRTAGGKPRNLVRQDGKDLVSFEEFARQEEVLGEYGGQLASFEWVFSPRGPAGRPLTLFNRSTGELDQGVLEAWRKYDIRLKLDREWPEIAPKLKGKLNIICGGEDTFHLEEAVKLLCQFLKDKGSDAVCEIVPGRDHMNLYGPYKTYPDGLVFRIEKEMQAKFEAAK